MKVKVEDGVSADKKPHQSTLQKSYSALGI
jgi:hypothetical protein